MRNFNIHIVLLLCCTISTLSAQESIIADKTSGCDSLTVQFTLNNALDIGDYTSVVWHFGDGTSASAVLEVAHTYLNAGVYSVSCILDGGRIIEESNLISVSLKPYADFLFTDVSDNEMEYKYKFQNQYFTPMPGVGLSYTWRFPDNSEVNDSVAEYLFSEESVYSVFLKIVDSNGCADSITKKVPVSKQLLVPNVFSPNNDEMNDYFEVVTQGDFHYIFKIFTKAGLQVYSSNSHLIRWDGRTIGGKEAPEGVYFYVIESDETPVAISQAGFLYLFR